MKIIITNPGRIMEERQVRVIPYTRAPRGPLAVLTEDLDQEILGFGAALTESACVLIDKLPQDQKEALMDEVFSADKANFSVARICVGASDYAATVYDYAPVADDLKMEHFDASHDDETILPVIRMARKYNPDLYLFASPWSPPGWMKSSHAMQGGFMLEKYLEAYALYYLKFMQHYLRAGVKINALTPQNETETDQSSRMPACYWHPDYEMKFAQIIRKMLDENEEFRDVKIWLMDHNFVMWHRAAYQMDDPATKAVTAGIAWHPYEGHPEQITVFRKLHPECENHWTEGNSYPGIRPTRPGVSYLPYHGVSFLRALNNGVQSITLWNLALDEQGYPNVGPFRCKGTFMIGRDGSFARATDDYYALRHLSAYVKRGAKRIVMDTTALPPTLQVSAFVNPDGQKVVVVANTEEFDSPLYLNVDGKTVELWILRESVSTVLL